MKALAFLLATAIVLEPSSAFAQRFGARGGGVRAAPMARPAAPAGRPGGFDLHNDARPENRVAPQPNRTLNNTNFNRNNTAVNRNNTAINHNNAVVNRNNVVVNRNNVVVNRGTVVVNPRYGGGAAWGWHGGVAWVARPTYWGGGFWGALAIGVTSAAVAGAVMGAVVNSETHTTYTSYQVQQNSPGATLLTNYHLQQVQCGPPDLVVIYGPQNGVICANPSDLVGAGQYNIDTTKLSLVGR